MRRKFFFLVVLCLVCVSSGEAQTKISLNEAETAMVLKTDAAEISLAVENSEKEFSANSTLELLDEEDKVRANVSQILKIKNGRGNYKLTMPLSNLMRTAEHKIVWYRLRYRIGDLQGIISLSELVKNDFELRVTASEYIFSGSVYRVRVRAFEPYTNQPAPNVKIEGRVELDLETDAEEDELKLGANGKTDAEGFVVLDFKVPENIKFDDGDLELTGTRDGIVRELSEDLDADENQSAVILSTDKPIYQPSQTFSVRGLYLGADQSAVPNSELEFKIKDEDGTLLYREKVKTSEFGIASISWKIPENAKLGKYRVEVEVDKSLRDDQIYFKVSRYDLPNFSVAAKPAKTFYLPGDKQAEISVSADYLFGKPVTKGSVRVVQESERRWNYREQKYEVIEEQTFEGETDADGKFIAKADLSQAFGELLDSGWKRFEDLHFAAYYTDLTTNKTEQKRFDVRLTKEPIHIYLVGRTINQNPKLPVTAYVSTFYADGTPAMCDVEIKGKFKKSPQYKNLAQLKTNIFGAGKFKFSVAPDADLSSDFQFQIAARDVQGKTGNFVEEINLDADDAIKIETEKTIFKPGESVKVKIFSTQKDALVYLDVAQNRRVLDSYFVRLKNGQGELKIPYNRNFKGDLLLAAYTDEKNDYYDDSMRTSRGIIFPSSPNLKLDAKFSADTYKPNEEAKINFAVLDAAGKKVESVLGIVIFDKAIEERARTDAEFGSYFSRFFGLLGFDTSFGGVTLKDLNEMDLSKPISIDLQLAAEVMLAGNYYYPRIYRTSDYRSTAKSIYAEFFKRQFAPIETALKNQYAKTGEHPADNASLRKILLQNNIDFDSVRDPWGQKYYAVFSTDKAQNIVTFQTFGADKKRNSEDFSVSSLSFDYFLQTGRKIDRAIRNYHTRTAKFVRDGETLRDALLAEDLDLSSLKDRWNHNYKITFEVSGRNYLVRFHSSGADGIFQQEYWNADDFTIWTSAVDYFAETEIRINEILNRSVNLDKKPFPQTENEFKNLLKVNGFDFERIRDGYGNPVYLTFAQKSSYADKILIVNGKKTITPITQTANVFTVRSRGQNSENLYDDFYLAEFSSIVTEQSKDTNFSKADVRNVAVAGAKGAIRGKVFDPNSAVIPNAQVTATDESDETKIFIAVSNDEGEFLLANLPSGKYTVKIESAGFKYFVYNNIQVRSQNIVEMNATLEVGGVSETVSIEGQRSVEVNVTASQVAELPINGRNFSSLLKLKPGILNDEKKSSVTQKEENSTPRLREYFPETLVWNPELITDKNGKTELKFKLADNLTTWKMYAIASTKKGKIGIVEKEIKTFQPFFADLEPPKILTVGDEIKLPVQIRNYTDKTQKVNVTMADGNWFSFLNPANQIVDVASNNSQNAVFVFRAETAVKNGKQRVTIIAEKDSDD
jgi:hypothetical protein